MSIYSTPISHLKPSDLDELLQERAIENARLEFKREVPDKDETLKKLSSFANTFGGYVVVGAAAQSKDGRIEELRGVDEVSGYKQKIVDWCFKECSPPIQVDVSGPITVPGDASKVCYVIFVAESEVAPHFLNGRKGVWMRTNEFSGRFEAALANENELQQLLHRRQFVLDRRSRIVQRARKRFGFYVSTIPDNPDDPTTTGGIFELCLMPRFPARQVSTLEGIPRILEKTRYPSYRGVGFPRYQQRIMTQHESAIIRQPLNRVSFFEANVWGMLFYAMILNEKEYSLTDRHSAVGIHLYEFVGHLLLFLRHATDVFEQSGLTGPILIETTLQAIRDSKWVYAKSIAPGLHAVAAVRPPSGLDDESLLSVPATVEELRENSDSVAAQLLRSIFSHWIGVVWLMVKRKLML